MFIVTAKWFCHCLLSLCAADGVVKPRRCAASSAFYAWSATWIKTDHFSKSLRGGYISFFTMMSLLFFRQSKKLACHPVTAVWVVVAMLFFSCEKPWNRPPRPSYSITIHNEFDFTQARYGAFLHGDDGKVAVFRWLKSNDTTQLTIPFSDSDRYHCTLVKLTINISPVATDTSVELTTWEHLLNEKEIYLHQPENIPSSTELKVRFVGVNSMDTLVLPNATRVIAPTASNNYFGHYQVAHYHDFWVRARFNGSMQWYYKLFRNNTAADLSMNLSVTDFEPTVMPNTLIGLPSAARWQYTIATRTPTCAPGWFVLDQTHPDRPSVNNTASVFQPETEVYTEYRMMMKGEQQQPNGAVFYVDKIWTGQLPSYIPVFHFDVTPVSANHYKNITVDCEGDFDILAIERTGVGTPSVKWTSWVTPATNGPLSYTLPDLPGEVAALASSLRNYNLGQSIKVRGERFDQLSGYEAVADQYLTSDRTWWKAEAGLNAVERLY